MSPLRTSRNTLLAGLALAVLALAGCGSAAALPAPKAPAPTVTMTVSAPAKTITRTATAPSATTPKAAASRAPAPQPQPQFANATAVVSQFYQDITDHNYAAAWAAGGLNVSGGVGYDAWVAGYGSTESISLGTFSSFGSGQVQTVLSALQTDGAVYTYTGTYTVQNGIIVAANIVQDLDSRPPRFPRQRFGRPVTVSTRHRITIWMALRTRRQRADSTSLHCPTQTR